MDTDFSNSKNNTIPTGIFLCLFENVSVLIAALIEMAYITATFILKHYNTITTNNKQF